MIVCVRWDITISLLCMFYHDSVCQMRYNHISIMFYHDSVCHEDITISLLCMFYHVVCVR